MRRGRRGERKVDRREERGERAIGVMAISGDGWYLARGGRAVDGGETVQLPHRSDGETKGTKR